MRRAAGIAAAFLTTVALSGVAAGPALASSSQARQATVKKQQGVAGDFVILSKSATSLVAQTVFTVPKTKCGSGFYSPAVSAQETQGTAAAAASVQLSLGCFGKVPAYGDAILTVGSKTKDVSHPLKAGAKVTITVTVSKSATAVKIAYSKKSSVTLKGKGGRPSSVLFGAVLPDGTPVYGPMKFSSTTVNKKPLSAFKPAAYESVTKAGKVNGVPSAITGKGKNFSISY